MSLFSFSTKIPSNGVWKLSNFGGLTETAQKQMPGYLERQRFGYIQFFGELAGCTATVIGYQQHAVTDFALPGALLIELPCQVEIRGPEGTDFIFESWETHAFVHRGARASLFAPGAADFISGAVPNWASTFDAQGDGGLFYSDAGLTVAVGAFPAGSTNVSIPQGARFVRMPAAGTSNNPKGITFRQL